MVEPAERFYESQGLRLVALGYAGTYPDRVSRLVVLDGAFLSGSQPAPIAEQMSRWIDQLDRISE